MRNKSINKEKNIQMINSLPVLEKMTKKTYLKNSL